jgi:hypothetical protein
VSNHPACENCRFWEKETAGDDETLGHCRKNPPVIIASLIVMDNTPIENIFRATLFPITYYSEWCGSHQRNSGA